MNATSIDSETGVPAEFWTFIKECGGDAGEFCAALAEMEREKLELYFLIYVQLRADLADVVLTSQKDCSEDAADDVADGLIARGRQTYLSASKDGIIPPREEWPRIEDTMLLHEFGGVYHSRFDAEIWDVTDALENERLPWETKGG